MERHVGVAKGGVKVVINCRPEASASAKWLLPRIAEGTHLSHGTQIGFGWSTFTLLEDGDSLAVHEPDFDRNPERDLRPDVTVSLQVQGQMLSAAGRLGVKPQFPHFSQLVAVEKGCLADAKVFLIRSPDRFQNDSGWLIFRGQATRDVEKVAVYRLLSLRPALMQVLAFPNDYMVVFQGDEVLGVQPPR